MAKLPRHAARHLIAALCALPAALALAEPALVQSASPRSEAKPSVVGDALAGTWYVLVHYTDDHAADPEQLRWEDRVWVFEASGSELRWTDYPIVVFGDASGRFERLGTNRARRVDGAWEPDAGQRAEIAAGLVVGSRGATSRTLGGSDARGWRSRGRAAPASASVVTYTEHWSVTGLPERPVFERRAALGSPRTEGLDGVTRFTTLEVAPDGALLAGRFERDDSRRGRFRMQRAGPVRARGEPAGDP